MPRLILLNGLPAVGKTTLARRYADDHPWTLVLELDALRRLLGGWRSDPTEAGLLARRLSLDLARSHLSSGRDVVLPQFLGRPAFLAQAEQVAAETGATFVEIVLTDDRDTLFARFARRTARAAKPTHVDAGWLVDRLGGDAALAAMHDRLLQIVAARPAARVLHCPEGQVDEVYRRLLAEIADADAAHAAHGAHAAHAAHAPEPGTLPG